MAEPGGYIAAHRKLFASELWLKDTFCRGAAWLDLIALANWKPGYVRIRGNRIDLKRGQLAGSSVFLAERWQWSRGKVGRFLNELENDQQIEQQKSAVTNVITILNYDKYQKTDSKTDSRRTADGQQTDTQEEETNNKQEGEEGIRPRRIQTADECNIPSSLDTKAFREVWSKWNLSLVENHGKAAGFQTGDMWLKEMAVRSDGDVKTAIRDLELSIRVQAKNVCDSTKDFSQVSRPNGNRNQPEPSYPKMK